MLKKLAGLFGAGNSERSVNRRIAEKLHDMPFKYISEKDESGGEIIIGRAGHINLLGEKRSQMCATCGVKTIFRLDVDEMKIWEFMSLDGCVINFTDLDTGKKRNISVYYDKHLS